MKTPLLTLVLSLALAAMTASLDVAAPQPNFFFLFTQSPIELWSHENLLNRINNGKQVPPESTLYWLTLTGGKTRRLVDDKTIQNFIDLNEFNLDQCKQAALKRRAQLCQSLMPQEMKTKFDAAENLRLFCRKTLVLVAENCFKLGNQFANKSEMSFIKSLGEILLEMKPEMDKPDHLSSMAAARYRPTALEGYLLEESGEN